MCDPYMATPVRIRVEIVMYLAAVSVVLCINICKIHNFK
jgi:hypothetical protein